MLKFFEVVEAGRGPPVKQRETPHGRYGVRLKPNLLHPIISKPINFQYESVWMGVCAYI
jgi:hypothetical protein